MLEKAWAPEALGLLQRGVLSHGSWAEEAILNCPSACGHSDWASGAVTQRAVPRWSTSCGHVADPKLSMGVFAGSARGIWGIPPRANPHDPRLRGSAIPAQPGGSRAHSGIVHSEQLFTVPLRTHTYVYTLVTHMIPEAVLLGRRNPGPMRKGRRAASGSERVFYFCDEPFILYA